MISLLMMLDIGFESMKREGTATFAPADPGFAYAGVAPSCLCSPPKTVNPKPG